MFSPKSSRCLRQALPFHRTYTLSRFPQRNTGASRERRRSIPIVSEAPPREGTPSGDKSESWKTSQRPPASNPSEGLKKLLLENDRLVIERQIEMLNIFIGFEQSNKYSICNELGEPLGYIAEEPRGFFAVMARQAFATHRPFRAVIMDLEGSPIMWVRRPFAWINSRMFVQRLKEYTLDGEPVLDTFAEVQQVWHPWRRRYDLFIRESPKRITSTASEPQPEPEPSIFTQFAKVDSGFLAWHFYLLDGRGEEIAYINRAFRGFGREIFTDTGQYSVNFGPRDELKEPGTQRVLRHLALDERALTLALAVNIDFDYFSRHSGPGHGGLFGMTTWE
ncbi:hypothetical protein Hypma_011469 [Hypsizygus marmoreus]|uniref:Phospholipid scramblase n=1 Tax=Hypsizygus marmoreus TaxID=39966 RepID=A0A369JFM7_HYPMA|nr:hypothetical protein Hypma_011469 [Hypsizygus marmoreus]